MRKSQVQAWLVLWGLWWAGAAGVALAAHTQASLVLAAEVAVPGEKVWAGIHLRMDPEWHTYWCNPGSSGMATEVVWELPAGIVAGPIHWPTPEKHGPEELVTYVYHDEVVLLVPLQLAMELSPGRYELRAKVSWLECKEVCLPGSANVSAGLTVGTRRQSSAAEALIESWRKRLPIDGSGLEFRAGWDAPPGGMRVRPVVLEWRSPGPEWGGWDFYPYAAEDHEVKASTVLLPSDGSTIRVRKRVESFTGDWPREVAGLVVARAGDAVRAWEVKAPIAEAGAAARGAAAGPSRGSGMALGLGTVLVYAFVGGLILNVMPCVLPVVALKVLGFVNQAREDRRRIRILGAVYTLGVLSSFVALAGLVIGLQLAGRQAGWGIQFGNPYFLVAMTVLITLIALNLFGVFEVSLGGRALASAASLAAREGAAGAFFGGLLTTVLATSCTAPFLGAAVGFAFAQPPAVVLLVLLTVGAGLAFPYLLLSWQPTWLKWMPKPGVWMERFKVAMGFPMLGAAVWLLSLAEAHYGERVWWLAFFLVVLAVAAWLFGTFWQRGTERRGLALATAVLLVLVGYGGLLEGSMRWRQPAAGGDQSVVAHAAGIPWEAWSSEAVEAARRQGRIVLVDFTARWCLTCQVNKKFALEVPSVREKIRQLNVLPLVGDYTHFPENITRELQRFGRAGVPLVVIYPRDPAREPLVLPETLTPGLVLEALEEAAQ